MNIEISDKYLWINVGREAETRKLEFFCDGKKFYEMDVKLTADGPDFFFSMDVSGYIGRTVEVRLADTGKELEQDTAVESQESVMEPQDLLQASLSLHSDKPGTNYKYRPEIHYTAAGGSNKWSVDAGNKHTQWLAVSYDGGDALEKNQEKLSCT